MDKQDKVKLLMNLIGASIDVRVEIMKSLEPILKMLTNEQKAEANQAVEDMYAKYQIDVERVQNLHMTDEILDHSLQFYTSPQGKALLEKIPLILRDMGEANGDLAVSLNSIIQAALFGE